MKKNLILKTTTKSNCKKEPLKKTLNSQKTPVKPLGPNNTSQIKSKNSSVISSGNSFNSTVTSTKHLKENKGEQRFSDLEIQQALIKELNEYQERKKQREALRLGQTCVWPSRKVHTAHERSREKEVQQNQEVKMGSQTPCPLSIIASSNGLYESSLSSNYKTQITSSGKSSQSQLNSNKKDANFRMVSRPANKIKTTEDNILDGDSSFDSQNCNFKDDYIEEKQVVAVVESYQSQRQSLIHRKSQLNKDVQIFDSLQPSIRTSLTKNQKDSISPFSKTYFTGRKSGTKGGSTSSKRSSKLYKTMDPQRAFTSMNDEIEQVFCKKYSRCKMEGEQDVFKRQAFESYKKHTKDERINNIKHKLQKPSNISKKQQEKCFNRLTQDVQRRKSMEKSIEREKEMELSLKRKKKVSQQKANHIYQQMMEKEEKKKEKLRILKEQLVQKELGELQQFEIRKRSASQHALDDEQEKTSLKIFERQWEDFQLRQTIKQKVQEEKKAHEDLVIKTYFKPQLKLSEQSFQSLKLNSSSVTQKNQYTNQQSVDFTTNHKNSNVFERLAFEAERRSKKEQQISIMTSFDSRTNSKNKRISSIESNNKKAQSSVKKQQKQLYSVLDQILDQKINKVSQELRKVVQEIGLKEQKIRDIDKGINDDLGIIKLNDIQCRTNEDIEELRVSKKENSKMMRLLKTDYNFEGL